MPISGKPESGSGDPVFAKPLEQMFLAFFLFDWIPAFAGMSGE
jgi:hypothetical protein